MNSIRLGLASSARDRPGTAVGRARRERLGEQLRAARVGQPFGDRRVGGERDAGVVARDLDHGGGAQVAGGGADGAVVLAALHHPAAQPGLPVRQVGAVDAEHHLGGLAGRDRDVGERLELARRAAHGRARQAHVDLHHLAPVPVAGVGDRDPHLDAVDGDGRARLAVLERGVGEAEAERVGHLLLAGVEAPVADVDALAVAHVPVLPGEVQVGGVVRQLERDRLGQPAGRVDHAEQHVGDRAAAGLPEQPALQDRGNARVPRPGARARRRWRAPRPCAGWRRQRVRSAPGARPAGRCRPGRRPRSRPCCRRTRARCHWPARSPPPRRAGPGPRPPRPAAVTPSSAAVSPVR